MNAMRYKSIHMYVISIYMYTLSTMCAKQFSIAIIANNNVYYVQNIFIIQQWGEIGKTG